MRPLTSVPNFSEGRDGATIAAIGDALAADARVLDLHVDADHNRSVFTIAGGDEALIRALLAAVAVARNRIDLRRHEGVHPRIGATDVVPIVPLDPGDMERARRVALALALGIGELGLPVFLYSPPERGPAFYRLGGPTELRRRLEAGELAADFGPPSLHPSAGAVLIGARAPLVALNVNLRALPGGTPELALEQVKSIAGDVRESGGGFRGVRALGLDLPSRGLFQVSMNIEDWQAAPLARIVSRIEDEARGTLELVEVELVGLVPEGAAVAAAAEGLAFDDSRILERAIARELG